MPNRDAGGQPRYIWDVVAKFNVEVLNLAEIIENLQQAQSKIPDEYRGTESVQWRLERPMAVRISYMRLETAEEISARAIRQGRRHE